MRPLFRPIAAHYRQGGFVVAEARRAGELAREHRGDVVVGFSHGATIALEMLLPGHFRGRTVLLGISLTTEDEAAFFRGVVRASQKLGPWPMAIILRLLPLMARFSRRVSRTSGS